MDSFREKDFTEFFKKLQYDLQLVQMYENSELLSYAAGFVPTEELKVNATLKLSLVESTEDGKSQNSDFQDYLLLELLKWFKYSFFQWVDIPKCDHCQQVPIKKGSVPPTEAEKMWLAHRVENYFCSGCKVNVRFPRYSHPRKLLETRKGRCGEWANCFTLLCRSLGYDARLVFDWNDHVWTEVFSFSKNRWLHCDPCENICDKPLLYEIGWKKPMSYVIAFSKDEVQDVTWRYTSNFLETLKRRCLCQEDWLVSCLLSLTARLQKPFSPEKRMELTKRRVNELVEFLHEPKAEESLSGRTSGSLAWRLARGEICENVKPSLYTFELSPDEIQSQYFCVKYCCASDKYIRASNNALETHSWLSCVFSYANIFRKEEPDWKMVYLAREDGTKEGVISWQFDFRKSGLSIKVLKLQLQSKTFDSGSIKWTVKSESTNHVQVYDADDASSIETQDFKGCTSLLITGQLIGGTGDVAWQHAQLFRQQNNSSDFPFEVEVYFDLLNE